MNPSSKGAKEPYGRGWWKATSRQLRFGVDSSYRMNPAMDKPCIGKGILRGVLLLPSVAFQVYQAGVSMAEACWATGAE